MLYFGTRACLFKSARAQDPTVKRMLSKLQNIGKAALPDKLQEVMTGIPRPPGTCSPHPGVHGLAGGEPGQKRGWQGRVKASSGEEGNRGQWEDASTI